jgi:catalase-peroxidase
LWPLKQKYGQALSWADLLVLAGNRAMDTMGFTTFGFAFGRPDMWAPEEDVYWGPEDVWLGDERYSGDRELADPLGAVQMGLIYVNPEGPNGNPDPMQSARDVRETFARMAMDDEETVALIAGGHTFGKMHGAADPDENVGAEPEGAPLEQQGLGWKNAHGSGFGNDTITSGIEGPWTNNPIQWDQGYWENLLGLEWEVFKGPGGANQWRPVDEAARASVPSAHDPSKMESPVMNTADIALKTDPIYREISERFRADADAFADAFARAWYTLLHRDMGPIDRYRGPFVPQEELLWQDPVPAVDHELIDDADVAALKQQVLGSGLTVPQLVSTAWASASTFRCTDMRGGANGARIRLSPQAEWDVNVVSGVGRVVSALEGIADAFNGDRSDGKKVSLADLIVLAGGAAIEQAAAEAGHDVTIPFRPGRTDATQEQTDEASMAHLEPRWDAFRNYVQKGQNLAAEHLLVDKAFTLGLSAPEMTALLGGLRVLGANAGGTDLGVLTDRPGLLTNDFFVNLLDMGTAWQAVGDAGDLYEGVDRASGDHRWNATRVDLVFGSNSELRALAEVYGASDGSERFVRSFVDAWTKVMEDDRFDLR